MYIYACICIYWSIYRPIDRSIHVPTDLSIHLPIYLYKYTSISNKVDWLLKNSISKFCDVLGGNPSGNASDIFKTHPLYGSPSFSGVNKSAELLLFLLPSLSRNSLDKLFPSRNNLYLAPVLLRVNVNLYQIYFGKLNNHKLTHS